MKRFTETEKWRDPWFRKLTPELKCLWSFICDNCDNAGVWDPDEDLARFSISAPALELATALVAFNGRVKVLPSGKWHITKFIQFQNGSLKSNNNCHISILELCRKHGIEPQASPSHTPGVGLPSPIGKGKGIGIGKESEKGGVGEGEQPADIPTLQEVTVYGEGRNVLPEVCKEFFDYYQGNNLWLNRHERMIDWRHRLCSWNEKAKGKPGRAQTPAAVIYAAEAQKKIIEEQISKHKANPQSVFYDSKCTDLDKAALRALRLKIFELNETISKQQIT